MSQITITITGLEEAIAEAIQQILPGIQKQMGVNQVQNQMITPPARHTQMPQADQPQAIPVQPIPVAPVQQTPNQQMPATSQIPVSQQTFMQVPTTAVVHEFTQDQLAVAAAGLVNQGKQARLMELLHSLGINSLVELPKERYGDFANLLRAEGAVI